VKYLRNHPQMDLTGTCIIPVTTSSAVMKHIYSSYPTENMVAFMVMRERPMSEPYSKIYLPEGQPYEDQDDDDPLSRILDEVDWRDSMDWAKEEVARRQARRAAARERKKQ
jgi:hypothetical protein